MKILSASIKSIPTVCLTNSTNKQQKTIHNMTLRSKIGQQSNLVRALPQFKAAASLTAFTLKRLENLVNAFPSKKMQYVNIHTPTSSNSVNLEEESNKIKIPALFICHLINTPSPILNSILMHNNYLILGT